MIEQGLKYRLGALYFGYQNFSTGINSEWIRHGIQNRFAHGVNAQRGFEMIESRSIYLFLPTSTCIVLMFLILLSFILIVYFPYIYQPMGCLRLTYHHNFKTPSGGNHPNHLRIVYDQRELVNHGANQTNNIADWIEEIAMKLGGGDFWEGAKNGLIVAGLNHVAHGSFSSFKKKWWHYTSDYTKDSGFGGLVLSRKTISNGSTPWKESVTGSLLMRGVVGLTLHKAASLFVVNSYGKFLFSGTTSALAATSFRVEVIRNYLVLQQKVFYGTITHNIFSGEIVNVVTKSIEIQTSRYEYSHEERVIYNLTNKIVGTRSNVLNPYSGDFNNALFKVGDNLYD